MAHKYLEVALSPAVLRAQEHYYGRSRGVTAEVNDDPLGPDEQAFIAERDSFYMATATESGWPYLQHRGGPAGFLRVLDPRTLVFADYRGNHQLISVGSLSVNDRVSLFLMDYPNRVRLKVLGRARVEDAKVRPDLVARIAGEVPPARVERLIFIDVVSFDWNCPKYITPRFTEAQVAAAVAPLQRRIAALEAQLGIGAKMKEGTT